MVNILKIKKLKLKSYRNYQQLAVDFLEDIVLIVGDNAQGKTNLVESIYTLAFSKSYRAKAEKELIQFHQPFAKIFAQVQFDQMGKEKNIDYVITEQGKKIKVNNIEQKIKADFVGLVKVIKFSPEDLSLIKSSPGVRRKFLDMYIVQLNKKYLITLAQYQRLLKQKNALLKQRTVDESLLKIYNNKLAEYIKILYEARQAFLEELIPKIKKIFNDIVNEKETLEIMYDSLFQNYQSVEEIQNFFDEKIGEEKNKFRAIYGIHKDDVVFSINGNNARKFGSQGQQRTIILSLIIALVSYFYEKTGEHPILILDDVMSELDEQRRINLIDSFFSEMQIFLTTTSVDDIIEKLHVPYQLIRVDRGNLIES